MGQIIYSALSAIHKLLYLFVSWCVCKRGIEAADYRNDIQNATHQHHVKIKIYQRMSHTC